MKRKRKEFMVWIGLIVLTLVFFNFKALKAMETEECLECHGDPSIAEDGNEKLFIDSVKFSSTLHAEEGCTACHTVSDDHPDDTNPPSLESCDSCHDDINEEYSASPHAENAECTDCHNPHYARGLMATSGFDQNKMCLTCHEDVDHSTWLPRSKLHMVAVPCITCHTPTQEGMVDFYITHKFVTQKNDNPFPQIKLATYEELVKLSGKKDIISIIDKNGDNIISPKELKAFNTALRFKNYRLWGMMVPKTFSHNFTSYKDRKDCSFCHIKGSKFLKQAFVSFPNKDGSFTAVPIKEGAVFDPFLVTPDFYVVGAGKNNILSIIGILMVLGGIGVVILHGTVRVLTTKNRRKH